MTILGGFVHITAYDGPLRLCSYQTSLGCFLGATHVAHDKRGCLPVCGFHAKWRSTTSCLMGHSPDCKEAPRE
jgi:hypothetical protein